MAKKQALGRGLSALLENANTSVDSIAEAAQNAEVILVATPPQYAESLATTFGESQGKIIIEATNAIRTKPENHATTYHAFAALTKAGVVKCFNSTGFENMKDTVYGDVVLDMFMAGDNADAKKVAEQLSKDAGFENCYDFGGANRVQLLEQFALSWINLVIFQGNQILLLCTFSLYLFNNQNQIK